MNILDMTVTELSQALSKKELKSTEITGAYLKAIEADQKDSKPLNAYIAVLGDFAMERAREADSRIAKGNHTPLTGIPVAVKDNMNLKGFPTTCASNILTGYVATYNSTVVDKLVFGEGMVPLGKANMDEFAMGSSTETSYYGIVRNPYDRDRIPGGSSGGSAAAVAGKLAPTALGSDTGGSIRQPASLCGVVGLKPTYGTVSRYGLVAFASSLDQIGPFCRTIDDTALMFDALSAYDPKDSTSLDFTRKPTRPTGKVEGMKIGIPKEYFIDGMDKDVEKVMKETIKRLEDKGAKMVDISLPHTEYAVPTYYIVATAEASSNLERFDGVKYGFRDEEAKYLSEMYIRSRSKGFGAEVKRRIMLGTYVLSAGYYDAYYMKALKVRTLIKRDFEKAFEATDAILTPVAPTPAFKIGEKTDDPIAMYLSDIFTISVNLAGVPAVSVPAGMTSSGLPVGAQVIGHLLGEETILNVAKAIEK
ncbi:MAG: aspartyl/glutamyl-tRNA amidotransferase subunit A [Spirochaetes bacterium GWF1_51_8]|nr:MAG: aspartyl/glutamyl-tRNA amidotransferase subunit A [Spirochaetes bacterium GWF1_51_8]